MRIVMFYHSLVSDWNHGNAHFLRGIVTELMARGHEVRVCEAAGNWSLRHLLQDQGQAAITDFERSYPGLRATVYDPQRVPLDTLLDGADLVIVHEWNPPRLVADIGRHKRAHGNYTLLFHDTHHRSVSDPRAIAAYDLQDFDGVLAFGETVRERYLRAGWSGQVFCWHEAADTRVFHPLPAAEAPCDLVWIGNWGDGERARELREFLIGPVAALGLRATVHGVRYPPDALAALAAAGITYGGWLANHRAPQVFARHRVTVHVPRRHYVQSLPGIPTIRVFEALACGIPLVSAPWEDRESLFTIGRDFLMVADGDAMRRQLTAIIADREMAREVSAHGLRTILSRHTCAHRVDELTAIVARLSARTPQTLA